ncbi:MAG TPA: hypothetical protein VNO84_11645 [Burkholderiaceae bacterium]|nr:hypothetical protein [Burkholderiaceae bacterium]
MSQYNINLQPGVPMRQQAAGRFFMVVSITGTDHVRLYFDVRGQGDRNDEEILTARPGFKLKLTSNRFDSVLFQADAACTVSYVISDNEVDFDFTEGATVEATVINPLPLPVSNDRGAPGNPVYVSGLTYEDAPATAVANAGPIVCGPAAVVVMAANPNRKAARFCNLGPDDVALGGTGLTWAARCIVLGAGDVWVEERGANIEWHAVTDAGATASVTVQEVMA